MWILGVAAFGLWLWAIRACTPAGLKMPLVQEAIKTAVLAEARMREGDERWNSTNMR